MAAEETRIAALVFIDIGFDLLDWPSRQEIRLLLRRLTHYSLFDAACFPLVRQNSPSVTMPGSGGRANAAFTSVGLNGKGRPSIGPAFASRLIQGTALFEYNPPKQSCEI